MRRHLLLLACLALAGIALWLSGVWLRGYHIAILTLAFLADYLTPEKYQAVTLDQAWHHWWQIGDGQRWNLYLHDSTLQHVTLAYAQFAGMVIILTGAFLFPWRTMKLRASTVHGSAHWANLKDARILLKDRGKKAAMQSQIPLGMYKGQQLVLKEKQIEEHVLIVGPSGKGKTAGIIAPGILSERGNRSLVIIDPKQELVRLTAGAVSQSMQIWLFAPTQPEHSHHYNPLTHISSMEEAEEFATCWVSNTGRSSDPFWDRNTELLITAVVLHLRDTEPNASFSRLADILTGSSFADIEALFEASPSVRAKKTAAAFLKNLKLNEKTAGGVMTDIAGRFFRLQNPKLAAVTATNDIDFNAMIEQPTAFYLSIPASAAERLQPLTACLLMQMFTAFVNRAEKEPQGQLPRGITCYLDEFANAGKIPQMAQKISMLRSTKVGLILAIQNYAQLDALYGSESKETILSNTTTHIVLPGTGQDEAEFYSRRIGTTTVIGQSMNKNAQQQSESWSQGQQEIGRRLIMPEEIRTMKKGEMLLLTDTIAPIKFRNIPYYQSQLIKRTNPQFQYPRVNEEHRTYEALTTPSENQQKEDSELAHEMLKESGAKQPSIILEREKCTYNRQTLSPD
ncbi:VirD4-like conjugal transfer protein, CD1115 family [Dictyobacter aurantiacus]|uniref:TRAG protein n=1 Tax=Dictyobacter aurantiacus TaxID=1936993 RepID=A0A401ZRM5_9CHLR|nr:type IV secretory system conjugative DNA transfer family protein [Dictyobacter aurantiacus]GCE09521.1 TRAG protein [Dictyobacter aurantiacus]